MKKIFAVFLMTIITIQSFSIYAAAKMPLQSTSFDDIEVTLDQLKDGVTVVYFFNDNGDAVSRTLITFDKNGKKRQAEVLLNGTSVGFLSTKSDESMSISSAGDGVVDSLTFHVGFKDWAYSSGDLYYTVACDEPMYKVKGSAYVKNTSELTPVTFYSGSFTKYLMGSVLSSDSLEDDINTETSTLVRVGFSKVYVDTVAGQTIFLGSGSSLVAR